MFPRPLRAFQRPLRSLVLLFVIAMPLFGAIVPWVNRVLTPQSWFVWASCSLFAPLILALAARFPVDGRGRFKALAIHLAGAIATNLTHTSISILFDRLFDDRVPFGALFADGWSAYLKFDLLVYGVIVAAVTVVRRRARARRSELGVARLETWATRAQYEAVRGSLDAQPIIDALTDAERELDRDPASAETRIERLSASLRAQLDRIRNMPIAPRKEPKVRATPEPLLSFMHPDFAAAAVFPLFAFLLNAFFVSDNLRTGGQDWLRLARVLPPYMMGGLLAFIVIVPARRSQSSLLLAIAWVAHAVAVEVALLPLEAVGISMPGAGTLPTTLILSAIVACAIRFDELTKRRSASRLAAENLTRLIAEARLRTLRTNLAPHFLFNTLNSILTLVRRDVHAARLMLDRLRRLLRVSFDRDASQEVTLREELEITNAYIDIERVRFRDALDVRMDVERDLLDALVPSFLLQPLVENAIRHGILGTAGRDAITVRAHRSEDSLILAVQNDGDILDPEQWRDGIGLSTTRARLAGLYGAKQELAAHADRGVEVRITLPLRYGLVSTATASRVPSASRISDAVATS